MTQSVLLGDICDIKIGRTPPRKETQWFSSVSGNPWASIKDMGNPGRYISETSEYLTNEAVKKFRIPVIPRGTLMMSFKLTVGRLSFALDDMYSNEAIAQLPIVDESVVDRMWLYYYLKNFNFNSLSSTSSIATAINSKTVKNIPIQLIDIDRQKKIADILGTIDEKIELNRRMNETLEQIGQALFRHYFIDNPDVKNWKIGTIDDLGDITTGKTPSKKIHEYFGKDMPFLKVPDMHNKSVVIDTDDGLSNLGVESQKSKTITKYSTCVSCIATVGVVSLSGVDLQTNQQINSIIPRQSHYRFYNYYAMSRKSDYIKTLASSGSATPNLNRGQFAKIPVVLPPDDFLKNFNKILEPVFEQIIENTHQISRLIQLRDLLLPKLISGREVSYCDRTIRENP